MVSKSCLAHLRRLVNAFDGSVSPSTYTFTKQPKRTMATISSLTETTFQTPQTLTTTANIFPVDTTTHITTTIYSFPHMEPLRFAYYPNHQLYLPLRRDILHRAIVYEGDSTRSGTANTKWRDDVHGSHKKLYQQKGTGRARVGDKQSPIRRGGGIAFGPKPRDFATKLQRKVYDLAWRTALSYRYRRGQLIVVDRIEDAKVNSAWFLKQIFKRNGWGNEAGRSLLVAKNLKEENEALFRGMGKADMGGEGRILELKDVDVKDLLEMGRVVIEERALRQLLKEHESDIVPDVVMAGRAEEPVPGNAFYT